MTQTSRPAATDSTTWPNSDAGPYVADQWSQVWQTLFTGDQHATQGPLIRYLNELAGVVQTPGATPVIRVATGAAMVNGHWFESDAVVDFTVTGPAVNPRIDVVVVAVNNTAVDFANSDGGFVLDFPDNLADYGTDADIEEYSCRLCIVQGVENAAPAVPGLDANNNHWMIPLYQYQIAVGGATSNETDRRDFCEFSTEVVTAMIADEAVTYAKLVHSAGLNVIGKATAGAGDPADIVAANDTVLARAGAGNVAFQQVTTAMIAVEAVDGTILRNSAAFSVMGRPGVAIGDPSDIVAGNDTVLAKLGAGDVAFQLIVPALVTDRTRKFLVPAVGGYNVTDSIALIRQQAQGWTLLDNKISDALGNFFVPQDFVSGMTATAIVAPIGAANIYSENHAYYGACTEAYNTTTDSVAVAAVGVTAVLCCIQTITLTAEAIDDIVSLRFRRTATDALDTLNASVYFIGWIIEYTADS